jgi:hypothetical protein
MAICNDAPTDGKLAISSRQDLLESAKCQFAALKSNDPPAEPVAFDGWPLRVLPIFALENVRRRSRHATSIRMPALPGPIARLRRSWVAESR